MARPLRSVCLILGLFFLAAAPAIAKPARSFYPLQDVRAGQRAVSKSVFRGTRIESFNLEVLGVLRKFDGTRSIILARVLDGPVVARKTGVIGGMSGSPVYIDGRLAGAIALTWPWSKEPIAGITPIEEMMAAFEEEPAAHTEPSPARDRALGEPVRLGGSVINRVRVSPAAPESPDPPGVMTLLPLSGFVQVSGFNARGADRLSELLAPYGLQVIPGPSGVEEEMHPPLVPGAVLGAKLVTGDFDVTALGTVTLVDGDRVLGFGHPILQRGEVDLPMTSGYVHDILSNLRISNKIMSPTGVVGRISRDHQSAVAGEVGVPADLVPVSIEVTDNDFPRSRQFAIQAVRARELMPELVASAVMTAVDETRGRIARGTARVSVEIDAGGRPPIRREDMTYSDQDAAAATLPAVLMPLVVFTDNPFGDLRINRLRVRVEAEDVRNTASIERVTLAQSRVSAGDEVTFNVSLRPYGRELVEVPVRLALPPDLPQGQVRIVISGGADAEQARAAVGAPRPQPVSLRQLIERYTSEERSSELVLCAALPRRGVSLLGEELPDLPGSALDVLRAIHPTDLRPTPSLLKVVVPTEWVLTGRQALSLQVDSPIAPGRPGPPQPPPGGPPPKDEEETSSAGFPPPSQVEVIAVGPRQTWEPTAADRKPAPERSTSKEEEAKPFTRAADSWVQRENADYGEAKLLNLALRGDGRLSLGLESAEPAAVPADIVWSVAPHSGLTYVGTGSEGLIYRVSQQGEVSEFFGTGEMNVHALAFNDNGDLYAATSPRGKLFRIGPDGAGELVCDSDSTYLWCLAVAPDGTVYAGGGSPARVYAISLGGDARVLAQLPAANVLSLAIGKTGDLYAGTSENGVVYRVRPDGMVSAICQVPAASADALLLDGEGNIYVSASPGGDIYRIPADGLPELYCETAQRTIHGLSLLAEGDLLAASGSRDLLVRIGPDRKPETMLRADTGLATAIAQADGVTYLGTSAPCLLRRLGPDRAASGQLESEVLDAGRTAHWGRMEWIAELAEGTEISAESRSGESPISDDHWSPWERVLDGEIASSPARYLQYRLTLSTSAAPATPEVQQIRISHRPRNRVPVCSLKSPKAGDYLSKKQNVAWQAADPDKDRLAFEVAVSSDLGKTWKRLKQDLRQNKYEWDTSKQDDGSYLLRVTASDSLSAPSDALSVETTIALWVDNTAPEIMLLRSALAMGDDRRATVTGWARDALSPIQSVEYRIDDGNWKSVPLRSVEGSLAGIFLSDVSIATEALEPGSRTLQVRAFDAAGNVASEKLEITVEGEPTPAAAEAEREEEQEEVEEEQVEEADEQVGQEGEDVWTEEGDETLAEESAEAEAAEPTGDPGEDR